MLQEDLQTIVSETKALLAAVADSVALTELEAAVMGRKGSFAEAIKGMATLSPAERPAAGMAMNTVKMELVALFEQAKERIEGGSGAAKSSEGFDVTMPGKSVARGHLHLITYAMEEIEAIFARQGFTRVRYPEVEWDYYAFEALNMPADHAARDEWETFFVTAKPVGEKGRMLLTPHTSSGQVREMRKYSGKGEPVRMLNIAKTYRRQIDVTHTPMFHQFEGLVVDRQVTITQLIGTLQYFVQEFFGPERKVRLRPYNFPFTEPSFEIDISCGICAGVECNYCKEGWSELGGAGMVHSKVLEFGGYNPKEFTGFAFGFGVERTYMMKNNLNIGDLRQLYSSDLNFLQQF